MQITGDIADRSYAPSVFGRGMFHLQYELIVGGSELIPKTLIVVIAAHFADRFLSSTRHLEPIGLL